MAYDPSNINGFGQRTYAERERDDKQAEGRAKAEIARRAASLKKYKAKRQDEIMVGISGQNRPKSPSPSSLPRSTAGVKTTTKTVNKLYRPSK